jgi:hypothetical protein
LPTRHREQKDERKQRRRRILTPIDEAVVVLLICLIAVPFLLESDSGQAFGMAVRIVVQVDLAEGTDGGLEKLLYNRTKVKTSSLSFEKKVEP